MTDQPKIIFLSDAGVEDEEDHQRFERMKADFQYFTEKSESPFAPMGFLHSLLDKAMARAYKEAYDSVGKAKDPNPYICAATHIKECQKLSKEITELIAAAMGDMQRGDLNFNMHPVVKMLHELGMSND